MNLNSFSYFLFLAVIYPVFYLTADRWRWLVLLAASYGFYASFRAPYLLAVLFMVTGISYACGLRIANQQDESLRKCWLWIGSCACVAILALLKYLAFFASSANSIPGLGSTLSSTVISIGVSYFSFQAISYLADVYLEVEEPEPHFGRYALYLAFFPKLLQGPIERAGSLLPQLKQPYNFDYDAIRSGLLLFTWGLFKKVVVADRLAFYADQIFNNVHDYSGPALVLGTYAYALQIYFDFAGYTDMARGTGRIFGIELTKNFNSPYLARSIADFWRRWHISFSSWILDYLFKPLQMGWRNRGQTGTALALLVTFLISGIWHGATWGFVIWGALHGMYLASSTYYRPYQKKLHRWLGVENSRYLKWWQIFVTFNMVSLAFVFFRANSPGEAWHVVSNLLNLQPTYMMIVNSGFASYLNRNVLFDNGLYGLLIVCASLLVNQLVKSYSKPKVFFQRTYLYRWSCYFIAIFGILIFKVSSKQFVYFQF